MNLDQILVTLGGFCIIAFVWWFFFSKKSSFSEAKDFDGDIDIIVEGGYKPSVIKIHKGRKVKISFTRKDENRCLEEIIIPDFKIKQYLPMNKKVEVTINPQKPGEYEMHCGMNMFHGKILVTK